MQVYKFGGASVKDAPAVRNVAAILRENNHKDKVVVISAMGKTTNALEAVVAAACSNNKEEAHALAHQLEQQHLLYAHQLLTDINYRRATAELNIYFTEMQWAIDDADGAQADFGTLGIW